MSRNLDKFSQPWNTYANAPYVLRFMTDVWEEAGMLKRILTESERLELVANVQSAIKGNVAERQN
jgi:hypothetical protein